MAADTAYQEKLRQEADLWGGEAERQAQELLPDWEYHRRLLHNAAAHAGDIDALLGGIVPGMAALELGCGSGWLTIALARRGAAAVGMDISARALDVARAYFASISHEISGSAVYQEADLNALRLPAESCDVVVIKGTLHHLLQPDHVLDQVHGALKPGGLLWISDSIGDETMSTTLAASALMFLLPTHVSYGDKIRGLLRFGARAPSRIKASIQAEGLSPFEGAGREHDWFRLVQERFTVERRIDAPAVTGYLAHQIKLPYRLALAILRGICAVDRALVRLRVLRSTGVTVYARKRPI